MSSHSEEKDHVKEDSEYVHTSVNLLAKLSNFDYSSPEDR